MDCDFEKIKKCNECMEIMKDIEYIMTESTGRDSCRVLLDEGNKENSSSLIFMDVASFTSFAPLTLEAFREALSLCDAINFSNAGDYVRITLIFNDTHIPEHETQIKEFKK